MEHRGCSNGFCVPGGSIQEWCVSRGMCFLADPLDDSFPKNPFLSKAGVWMSGDESGVPVIAIASTPNGPVPVSGPGPCIVPINQLKLFPDE